ncbi:MAG TPA: M61 family peptidase [Fulvivirga sp.]|nr:M61 family peptidase [Fulvivirga sp.]
MKYLMSLDSPLKHFIKISLEIDNINDPYIDLKLPIWRPGRYEAANYAKNIQSFNALEKNGKPLKYEKINSSCWRITTEHTSSIKIEYNYYAHQMDAGNSWYGENQVYINFVNCMLYNDERLDEPCEITLDFPKQYTIACGLKKTVNGLEADNYHLLADSPLIASGSIQHLTYKVDQYDFNIWIQGDHQLDSETLIKDFKKFSEYQIRVMGELPTKDYHFLIQITPYKFYHGVEHGNSTVIAIGPGAELTTAALYSELLGVSSHELFHAWNILKIRPKEMLPYDFGKPPIFDTGFVAEGFTTYYGDLFLVQSGVYDKPWYFNELNKLFQRHFLNFGRLNNSVVDSSIDLWVDGYQPSAPHKKSSIYAEGAMIAFTLDLMIRQQSRNERSLDDVMRVLWKDYGQQDIGYTKGDILKVCEQVFDGDLKTYFRDYVDGTKAKESLVNELLGYVGCELKISPSESLLERELGIKVVIDASDCTVVMIAPGSIGEDYLSVRDKILKINGESITEESLKNLKVGNLRFEIDRNYKIKHLEIETAGRSYLQKHAIVQMENPSQVQRDSFEKWLNVKFD